MPMPNEPAIVKEYQPHQIEMRGPGAWDAKPSQTGGATCILRLEGEKQLSASKLAVLFNAAAKDYPALPAKNIRVYDDHIEFFETPKADYKRLAPLTIGARG
jgi:hypothetical protein